ncbi:SDR family NAD(P)-dependent oxidoreductase [Liquorilactobacillus oeni]|uniref:Short chain dehydrogenase n=1 Tax=Liquorilactobacillus oeni DSM 19972 TaxID=1423777 RepID=A0A0R1MGQ5_9LACO|nr:SDR family oxidoreductase [Liquorilactobacillus oeni]KRL05092.1 short chain dehydrogenase [Liquorilactobacillus oeni DSM 19972]
MKTVVITGAASGMGLSATKLFLEKNWNVMLADFNDEAGKKAVKELTKSYQKEHIAFQKTNVASAQSVKELKAATAKVFGAVDSVVNNAGIFTKGALHEVSEEAWDRIMAVDVKSIFLMTKYFVPDMIQQKAGTIVNTASISGLTGDYNMAAYNAAKGAVVNLVRAMALDYGKYNIRVNNVAPGPTNTPMFQANPPQVIKQFKEASPLGRIVEPEEIAKVIYFLASEDSHAITGENIPVSTGFEIYSGQPVQN